MGLTIYVGQSHGALTFVASEHLPGHNSLSHERIRVPSFQMQRILSVILPRQSGLGISVAVTSQSSLVLPHELGACPFNSPIVPGVEFSHSLL